jgi:hypothetical protein
MSNSGLCEEERPVFLGASVEADQITFSGEMNE